MEEINLDMKPEITDIRQNDVNNLIINTAERIKCLTNYKTAVTKANIGLLISSLIVNSVLIVIETNVVLEPSVKKWIITTFLIVVAISNGITLGIKPVETKLKSRLKILKNKLIKVKELLSLSYDNDGIIDHKEYKEILAI